MSKEDLILELFYNYPTKHWHFEEIRKEVKITKSKADKWLKRFIKQHLIKVDTLFIFGYSVGGCYAYFAAMDIVKKYVRYGSSPRGVQALVLAGKILALMKGRYNVSFSDIREVAYSSLRHRIILNFEGEAEGIKPETVISQIIEKVPELSQ